MTSSPTPGGGGGGTPSLLTSPSITALHRSASQSSFGSGMRTPQHQQRQSHNTALNDSDHVQCLQTLTETDAAEASVLAVAHTSEYVFSGTQRGDIHVWRRSTYRLERTLHAAHAGGCQVLTLGDDNVLFSGGGDGTVRAWDSRSLTCLYVIYAGINAGSVMSLVYWRKHQILVLGCQNTSIQLFDVANRDKVPRDARVKEMHARRSRFFDDAVNPIAVRAPYDMMLLKQDEEEDEKEEFYVVFEATIERYAHTGYVHSLALGTTPDDGSVLFSAASDGIIGVWRLQLPSTTLERVATLDSASADDDFHSEGDVCVHTLAVDGDSGLLFAGLQNGAIDVWDLETWQRIRTLRGSVGDQRNVFALVVNAQTLYSAAADGTVRLWRTSDLKSLGWIRAATDAVLALDAVADDVLVSSSSGGAVVFWDVAMALQQGVAADAAPALTLAGPMGALANRRLVNALARWVRIKSVSGVAELQPECRRAARFLKDLMRQLGAADARLISSSPSSNPIVYGRFDATAKSEKPLAETPTVFVYGHYDVMPAGDEALWSSKPFEMTGRDGYLYGRGVTDDKGPVLATLFAVAELHAAGLLPVAVVFCIEGEEEHGSVGLRETLADHRALFGEPRLVLLSSSYWLGETTPCLTYGMRGSIRATLRIESTRSADVHAGVWGGAVNEPLACLAHVVAQLADPAGRVLIPGFMDDVRAVDAAEDRAMHALVRWIAAKEATAPLVAAHSPPAAAAAAASSGGAADGGAEDRLRRQLMQRWRLPSLTVHHVDVSTAAARSNATLVPAAAQAALSVRVVPDQSLDDIAAKLRRHVTAVFDTYVEARKAGGAALLDDLHLDLDVRPNAMWWLADPEAPVYQAAARAIREEWALAEDPAALASSADSAYDVDSDAAAPDVLPLLIREGGSIPAVPWLESFFAPHAVAVNIPMGQSSDNAHLDNERISQENLVRGRQVIYRLIKDIGDVI
ncbi:hypothetical protein GGI23_000568 [Coemansia sp. RSA 2559]|nr:hypothetical protein GGI23_000568 [Coemansia sp. RSA 2559]